jgi:hypothetical protein
LTFVGFEPLFRDITVENQNNPNLDIELTETSEQLQTIEVVGRKKQNIKTRFPLSELKQQRP